jgi:hypothetical protein
MEERSTVDDDGRKEVKGYEKKKKRMIVMIRMSNDGEVTNTARAKC